MQDENIKTDDILTFRLTAIPRDQALLPGIHGLRGIAALAVTLFHLTTITEIAVPAGFTFIASDFNRGAHLFFVLSAFSLMYSTEHTMQCPTWVTQYFIIAPLYYLSQ